MSTGLRSVASRPRVLLALIAAFAGGAYALWTARSGVAPKFHPLPSRVEGTVAVSNETARESAASVEPVVRALARRSITITLESTTGTALRGASLSRSSDGIPARPVDPARATTTFELGEDAFASWLLASADGHLPKVVRPDDPSWRDPELRIRLEPGVDVAFRVEEATHRAIEGAQVRLASRHAIDAIEGMPAEWRARLQAEVATNGDGLATLAVPAAQNPIEIDADARGYGPRHGLSIALRPDGSPIPIQLWALAVAGVSIDTGLDGVPPQAIAPLRAAFPGDGGLKPASPGNDARKEIEQRLAASVAGRAVSWVFAIEGPTAEGLPAYPQRRELTWRPLPESPELRGELVFRRVADFDPRDVTRLDAREALAGRLATLEVEFGWNDTEEAPTSSWGLRSKDRRSVTVHPWSRPDPMKGRRTYTFLVAPGSWVLEPCEAFVDPAPFAARDVDLVAGETKRLTLDRTVVDPAGTLAVKLDDGDLGDRVSGWNLQLRSADRRSTVTISLEEKRRFRVATGRYTAIFWKAEVSSPATPCEIRSGETTTLEYPVAH